MKSRINQTGFSPVEVVIALVVIAALVFTGFTFYNRQKDSKTSETANTHQAADEPEVPEINSASDLDKANSTLDSVDVEGGSDSSQLDSETNRF